MTDDLERREPREDDEGAPTELATRPVPEADAPEPEAPRAAWLTETIGSLEDAEAWPSAEPGPAVPPVFEALVAAAVPVAEGVAVAAVPLLEPEAAAPVPPDDDPMLPSPRLRLTGLALGIDVGGTGVKAALVDLTTAELVSERVRERTPQPATPEAITETILSVVGKALAGHEVPNDLPVGCGLPGVVKRGRLTSAANIDAGWIGWPAEERIGAALGRRVLIVNDADAAGLAEMAYGAGEGRLGTVLLLTIGTGIGSALFIDGHLVPNTELGHLELHGRDAETLVSGAARERRKLGWKAWARQFAEYLRRVQLYLSPDLWIMGGGVSKEWARWGKYVDLQGEVVTARYLNTSGIIGAAYAAAAAAARDVALGG